MVALNSKTKDSRTNQVRIATDESRFFDARSSKTISSHRRKRFCTRRCLERRLILGERNSSEGGGCGECEPTYGGSNRSWQRAWARHCARSCSQELSRFRDSLCARGDRRPQPGV